MRVRTILSAEIFKEARTPAIKLNIHFGDDIGIRKASVQITDHYTPEGLIGKQISAIVNFPKRQIGQMMSECLVIGFIRNDGSVILECPIKRQKMGLDWHKLPIIICLNLYREVLEMKQNANLFAHFQSHFPDDSSTCLLITDNGQTITYGQADEASAQIANSLLELGASLGDRVTVQVEKSVEALYLYLGCLRAGLVYHPLNTAYTASEIEYFLTNAEPSIIICKSEFQDIVKSVTVNCSVKAILTLNADGTGTLLDLIQDACTTAQTAMRCGTDMAALLYSSGTTGRPKGIMLSHDNLRSNAEILVDSWGFSSSDRLLHMLPIYHVHGLFVGISCVLMSGASMSWHKSYNDDIAVNAMPECTVMMGVPTYYTRLLKNHKFSSDCCQTMRLFISGSAPLLSETFHEFKARCGHTILERYGMSETNMNTSNPLDGERKPGTVGPALPGVLIKIVDDQGQEVILGDIGNLQVKGPNVFSGYWRMPEKTKKDFTTDGFFNTGDKASIDDNGYISIVGRSKDLIICGGLNVYPKEVEMVIDDISEIKESAIIGAPDADFGEVVVAIIVVEDSYSLDNKFIEKKVINYCKTQLANFKIPKRVDVVNSLPRNAMGKVQKNLLRDRLK
ncbi:MAG: malonyl-CoA synthase [SAR92 clade bacterium]|uniref:Malonyl-CoA synthase n=1 Tax=SAR92 clade bacterium TaxID=2315479 RepID=A0A520MP92_9GAMM|nr:MAG: malonyl-CoA synthase [SAR92 clade bacterium]